MRGNNHPHKVISRTRHSLFYPFFFLVFINFPFWSKVSQSRNGKWEVEVKMRLDFSPLSWCAAGGPGECSGSINATQEQANCMHTCMYQHVHVCVYVRILTRIDLNQYNMCMIIRGKRLFLASLIKTQNWEKAPWPLIRMRKEAQVNYTKSFIGGSYRSPINPKYLPASIKKKQSGLCLASFMSLQSRSGNRYILQITWE